MAHLLSGARASLRTAAAATRGARFASINASSTSTPFLASKTAAYGSTAFAVGTLAWYSHMYAGGIPFMQSADANMIDEGLHPPAHPWSHSGLFDTFDHSR